MLNILCFFFLNTSLEEGEGGGVVRGAQVGAVVTRERGAIVGRGVGYLLEPDFSLMGVFVVHTD